jgi:hypothetical protein
MDTKFKLGDKVRIKKEFEDGDGAEAMAYTIVELRDDVKCYIEAQVDWFIKPVELVKYNMIEKI